MHENKSEQWFRLYGVFGWNNKREKERLKQSRYRVHHRRCRRRHHIENERHLLYMVYIPHAEQTPTKTSAKHRMFVVSLSICLPVCCVYFTKFYSQATSKSYMNTLYTEPEKVKKNKTPSSRSAWHGMARLGAARLMHVQSFDFSVMFFAKHFQFSPRVQIEF